MRRAQLLKRNIVPLAVLCCLVCLGSQEGRAQSIPQWLPGDLFVAIGSNSYQVYRNSGTEGGYVLVETLNDGLSSPAFTTGCAFDASDNLYTTDFSNTSVVKYDANVPHSILQIINTTPGVSETGNLHNEAITFASNGDFLVGHADGDHLVQRYNAAGALQQSYAVAIQDRGSDWIELSSDQHTLFYTSEGSSILRYDLSANEGAGAQLANFANLTGGLYALRLLPPGDGSGGLLVTSGTAGIQRLDGSGNVIQTYGTDTGASWFALNLDSDGTSFWAGDINSAKAYKFDITSGSVLAIVQTGAIAQTAEVPGTFGGICIKGQRAAVNTISITQTLGGPGTTTTYTYNTDTYKITGVNNVGGEVLTVTAFLTRQSSFPSLPGFPQETCIPYGDFSSVIDTCVEFQTVCSISATSTTPCDFIYTLATGFDLPADLSGGIGGPDFLVAHGVNCPLTSSSTVQSIFLSYEATVKDPTVRGGSRGPSCFSAMYTPGAPPILTGTTSSFEGWEIPYSNTKLNTILFPGILPAPLTFDYSVSNLTYCPSGNSASCTTPWVSAAAFPITCPGGAPPANSTAVPLSGQLINLTKLAPKVFPKENGLTEYLFNWKTVKGSQGCVNVELTFQNGPTVVPAVVGFEYAH
jgi:hypothetical protein